MVRGVKCDGVVYISNGEKYNQSPCSGGKREDKKETVMITVHVGLCGDDGDK